MFDTILSFNYLWVELYLWVKMVGLGCCFLKNYKLNKRYKNNFSALMGKSTMMKSPTFQKNPFTVRQERKFERHIRGFNTQSPSHIPICNP